MSKIPHNKENKMKYKTIIDKYNKEQFHLYLIPVHTVDSTTKLKILQGVCLIDRTLCMSGTAGSKTFQKAKIQA